MCFTGLTRGIPVCSDINAGDLVTGMQVALRSAPWLGGQHQVTSPEFLWGKHF